MTLITHTYLVKVLIASQLFFIILLWRRYVILKRIQGQVVHASWTALNHACWYTACNGLVLIPLSLTLVMRQ